MYTQRTRILGLLVGAFAGVWGTGEAAGRIADSTSEAESWGVYPTSSFVDQLTAFQSMVLGILQQLETVLDEDWDGRDETVQNTENEVEQAAVEFVQVYHWVGVAPGLTPQEAAEADQNAELAQTAVVSPESGVTGALLTDLLETLASLRADLAGSAAWTGQRGAPR